MWRNLKGRCHQLLTLVRQELITNQMRTFCFYVLLFFFFFWTFNVRNQSQINLVTKPDPDPVPTWAQCFPVEVILCLQQFSVIRSSLSDPAAAWEEQSCKSWGPSVSAENKADQEEMWTLRRSEGFSFVSKPGEEVVTLSMHNHMKWVCPLSVRQEKEDSLSFNVLF